MPVARGLTQKYRTCFWLILLFAITNAVLYSCLLPLWAGFDEPAHYGYVEYLTIHHQLPIVNRTPVSKEIRESLKLVPVGWILHNALPGSISFEDWFHLSPQERRVRKIALEQLSPTLREQDSDLPNYEVQQAPLAYLLLAPLNAIVSRVELARRVWYLRLLISAPSSLLLLYAARLLLNALGLTGIFRLAALACIFESQMLWASIAHVGNDWLAIPLGALFFALLVLAIRETTPKYALALTAVLAAGLLTKAYFLAFVPIWLAALLIPLRTHLTLRTAAGAVCIILFAASWYARNVFLYESLSGTQEAIAGIGAGGALEAFSHINWLTGTIDLFRWGLWTGNWSFVSFSRLTLNIELILMVLAIGLLFMHFRKITAAEWWVLAACFVFYLGLVYQTCVTWVATHGQSLHAEPWYMQCILPCIWSIAFLGLQRNGAFGRMIAALIVSVTAWIAAATYLVKLIPLYGGFSGRSTLPAIAHWWIHLPVEALSATLLGPLAVILVALFSFLCLLVALNVRILAQLCR